jgi:hypothetical protein
MILLSNISRRIVVQKLPIWKQIRSCVRFEVFTAVTMKNGVFWDVTPCGSCKSRRFGGTWRLLYQGGKIDELGTTLVVISNQRMLHRLLVTASVVPSSLILVTLMKEALSSSETSVLTRATRRNISENIVTTMKTSNLT